MQKPVSVSSGSPPTPGPHTTTGDAAIACATAGGSRVPPCAPPPSPAVVTLDGCR